MISTDSIILIIVLGIKVSLLVFIFQDKLLTLLNSKKSLSVSESCSESENTQTGEESIAEKEETEETQDSVSEDQDNQVETSPEVSIIAP